MEYAAIESRLEVFLGLLNLPCNRNIADKERRKVQISHRIKCAKECLGNFEIFNTSKLDKKYFDRLSKWIKKRDEYVHGLYKNEIMYETRIAGAKEHAEKGEELCRLLYNEVNRLKRLRKTHPEVSVECVVCNESRCCLNNRK